MMLADDMILQVFRNARDEGAKLTTSGYSGKMCLDSVSSHEQFGFEDNIADVTREHVNLFTVLLEERFLHERASKRIRCGTAHTDVNLAEMLLYVVEQMA